MATTAQIKKPPVYGPPEKINWTAWIAFSVFLFIGACVFYWLMEVNTPEASLVCENRGAVDLHDFGTCHEE